MRGAAGEKVLLRFIEVQDRSLVIGSRKAELYEQENSKQEKMNSTHRKMILLVLRVPDASIAA